MIINIKAARTTFFFLGNITAIKGQGSVAINLDEQPDSIISSLVISIKGGTITSDADIKDIAAAIKDAKFKKTAYQVLGIPLEVETGDFSDVITTELIVEEIAQKDEVEPVVEPVILSEEDEYKEYIDNLKDLIDGNVKIVVEKLSNAALSDEDKIQLIDLEQNDKNRKAVLTAINEL